MLEAAEAACAPPSSAATAALALALARPLAPPLANEAELASFEALLLASRGGATPAASAAAAATPPSTDDEKRAAGALRSIGAQLNIGSKQQRFLREAIERGAAGGAGAVAR